MVMWQLSMPVRIKPMLFSKLNTALQLLLVGVVLFLEGFGLEAPWLRTRVDLDGGGHDAWLWRRVCVEGRARQRLRAWV